MAIVLNANEFFTGLTNLALFMRLYATNTSRVPDTFVDSFATETLAYGDTKIFTFSDLPEVEEYSPTSTLLEVVKNDNNQETISITESKVIRSSFSTQILEMAFTGEEGLNDFTGYLLGQMESAKTAYLYDMIVSELFTETFGGTKQNVSVNVWQLDSSSVQMSEIDSASLINQKNIALAIQDNIQNMQVYNNQYNQVGTGETATSYYQALALDDLRLVICNPYNNEQVVNLMATLLKSNYIVENFERPKTLVIPTIKIPTGTGNANVICWIMHRFAYQWFYKFTLMGSFFDVSNLTINNFLHFWFGKGWLKNLPVCKIVANPVQFPVT
jgi:hypothetical protein